MAAGAVVNDAAVAVISVFSKRAVENIAAFAVKI